MTTSIPVHVVRVFTTDAGELGNELGIVVADGSTAGREQEIAARLGFSETVFVGAVASVGESRVASLRIFTPAVELPFAGHPTVGTAWWLRERGESIDALAVPAGEVAVRIEGGAAWATGRASWAPSFTWHAEASVDEVVAADPMNYTEGQHYLYASIDERRGLIRSRMFAPRMGIAEDEATGSAAIALASLLGRDLDIVQGRGSRILTRYLGADLVEVGGAVVADPDRVVELGDVDG